MTTLRDAAMRYASRGRHVFPCTPERKTPLTPHGCLDATVDLSHIREWWTKWPNANVALATGQKSGLIVLDYDCKNGKRGLETLESLRVKFRLETLEAITPSEGVHLFFQYAGSELKNGVDVLPGMDLRTTGGYVLVAPSIVNGKPYRWTRILPPSELPVALLESIRKPEPVPATPTRFLWMPNRLQIIERARRYMAAVPPAVQGQAGDISTYKLACRLVRGFALTDDEALALLAAWNWRCQPQWSERDLLSKIASARKNGQEPYAGRLEMTR